MYRQHVAKHSRRSSISRGSVLAINRLKFNASMASSQNANEDANPDDPLALTGRRASLSARRGSLTDRRGKLKIPNLS